MSTTEVDVAGLGVELSKDQRRAVEYEGGPLAVLAGPGSGKTRVIVRRVARLALPAERGGAGAEPRSVVALAFTNKSAGEMEERLAGLLGQKLAGSLSVGTCHSFGRRLLGRFGDVIGLPAKVRVMDSACQRRMLRRLAIEHGLFQSRRAEGIENALTETIEFIAECQNGAIEPAKAVAFAAREQERLERGEVEGDETALEARRALVPVLRDRARLFELYDAERLPKGRVTLDDYIALPVRILRASAMASAVVRDEVRHVVVDEFQDWNPAQIELLRAIAPEADGAAKPDVCVVGDDDQSIYAFRGADDRAFARFEEYWPSAQVVRLATNYRSAAPVVDAAKAIIGGASTRFDPGKEIEANEGWSGEGAAGVEGVVVDHDSHIGSVVGAMILADRQEGARAWSSYAVLARTGGVQEEVVAALEALGIPVTAKRKTTPLDDAAVQDLLSWMRLLADDNVGAQVQRLLTRPLAGATYEMVSRWRREWRRAAGVGDDPGVTFLAWLEAEAGDAEPVVRLLRTRDELSERVRGVGAADAAMGIIQGASLVEADGLVGAARAPRIARLGAVYSFIRECEADLDPPGGVREFVEYYDDLSEKEKAFTRAGEDAVDGEVFEDEGGDAVSVLTAHSAKGLEFDTVFVARVRPGHGFPQSDKGDERYVPAELSGRVDGNHDDEERRVFYVACTRAERRLVLIAKTKKSRGKTVDYFIELEDELGEKMPVVEAADWLSRGGVTVPEGVGEDGEALADRLDAMVADARHDGARALFDAEKPAIDPGEMKAIHERLRDAAERLAMIAHLRETGVMHAALAGADETRAGEIERRAAEGGSDVLRAMRAPLKLSYSMVNDYLRCPACFYVKRVLGFDGGTTSALTVGNAVHAALERFYIEVRDAEAEGAGVPGLERLVSLGEGSLRRDWPAATPVDADAFSRVRGQLELFWEKMHDPSAEILLLEGEGRGGERVKPFGYSHRGEHTVIAKIDRVDRLPDGGFRIVDYKTGEAWKRLTEPKKDDLQLCIYAMALQEHLGLEEPPAGSAEYWVVSTGERGVVGLEELNLKKARASIDKAIDGMLDGEYPRKSGRECSGLCEVLGL